MGMFVRTPRGSIGAGRILALREGPDIIVVVIDRMTRLKMMVEGGASRELRAKSQ